MVETFSARALALGVGVVAAIGCGAGVGYGSNNAEEVVIEYAAREFRCRGERVRVEEVWGGRWEARGCDQRATYDVDCHVAEEGRARCNVRPPQGAAPPAMEMTDAPFAPH